MRGFLGAVTVYPTVIFTFALIVVVAYWVLVLVGGAHLHGARGGGHGGHVGGHGAGHGGGHGAGPAGGHGSGHGGGHAGGHGAGHSAGHSTAPAAAHAVGQGGGHGGGHAAAHGGAQRGAAQQGQGHDGGRHGQAGLLRVVGLGGVPITVAISLVVAFGWFTALAGRAWAGEGARWYLLPVALAGGWAGARLLVAPLRRMMPEPPPPPSRWDFVGLGCVIRTGRVGPDFGQAEVRAADGSAALVQVRQSLDDAAGSGLALRAGTSALIYDYDADGEFFWVMPAPPASG